MDKNKMIGELAKDIVDARSKGSNMTITGDNLEKCEDAIRDMLKEKLYGDRKQLSYMRLQKCFVELFELLEDVFYVYLYDKVMKHDDYFNDKEVHCWWLGEQNNFISQDKVVVCTQPKWYTVNGIYTDIDRFICKKTSMIEMLDGWYAQFKEQLTGVIYKADRESPPNSKMRVYLDAIRFRDNGDIDDFNYDMQIKAGVLGA